MSVVSVSTLFLKAAKEAVFAAALDLAQALGLETTSWRTGDPTLVELQFISEQYETRDVIAAEFAKSAFLSTAEDDWLKLHASEVYGVEATAATYATPTVTLHNSGGGVYPLEPGELTVKCTATGTTFHNTDNPGTLSGGTTRTYQLVSDLPGAAGTVAANDVDYLVTQLLGVTITSSTSAVGTEAQSDTEIKTECSATLGALSAAGPKDAFESVCLDSTKTGTEEITRARTQDGPTFFGGEASVYVAGPSGAVSGGAVTAAQNACVTWAEPIAFGVTVLNSIAYPVNVSLQVSGDAVPSDIVSRATVALGALFAAQRISLGNADDTLAVSLLTASVHAISPAPAIRKVNALLPAADVAIPLGYVPVPGTITIAVV